MENKEKAKDLAAPTSEKLEGDEQNRNVSNSQPLDKEELAENLSESDSSLEKPKDQEA